MNFGLPVFQELLLRHGLLVRGALAVALIAVFALGIARDFRGWVPAAIATAIAVAALTGWLRWRRERLIREAPLPQFLKRKLRESFPHLTQKDAALVERGLRQFFLACHRSELRFVAMRSRVVDAMWHEFILHTPAYRAWCALAMGRFLHHTPSEVLGANAGHNDGLRRAWYWSCRDETIDPRLPARLPLLFALDAKLEIPNGFRYEPYCHRTLGSQAAGAAGAGAVHCAAGFGDESASGDGAGFGGEASSADDGDDGDGDGGDGCSGGGD